MKVNRCPVCDRPFERLECLRCDGTGLARTSTKEGCVICDGSGRDMRCRDVVWHVRDRLRDRARLDPIVVGHADASAAPPMVGMPGDAGAPIMVAPERVIHARQPGRTQWRDVRPVGSHQRAVENRERMRQAPRNQKRMPRVRKEPAT